MNQLLKILRDPIGAATEVKDKANLRNRIIQLSRKAAAGDTKAREELEKLRKQYNKPLKFNK